MLRWQHKQRKMGLLIIMKMSNRKGKICVFKNLKTTNEWRTKYLNQYHLFLILIYGIEQVTEASRKKMDAFEMWLYRPCHKQESIGSTKQKLIN